MSCHMLEGLSPPCRLFSSCLIFVWLLLEPTIFIRCYFGSIHVMYLVFRFILFIFSTDMWVFLFFLLRTLKMINNHSPTCRLEPFLYLHVCTHALHTSMHIHVHIHIHACLSPDTHHMHAHAHTYVYTLVHIYVCI